MTAETMAREFLAYLRVSRTYWKYRDKKSLDDMGLAAKRLEKACNEYLSARRKKPPTPAIPGTEPPAESGVPD